MWTPQDHADYDGLNGIAVASADGVALGTVVEVLHPQPDPMPGFGGHSFLVRPAAADGPLGPRPVYVPESAVAGVQDERLVLSLPASEVGRQGWPTE